VAEYATEISKLNPPQESEVVKIMSICFFSLHRVSAPGTCPTWLDCESEKFPPSFGKNSAYAGPKPGWERRRIRERILNSPCKTNRSRSCPTRHPCCMEQIEQPLHHARMLMANPQHTRNSLDYKPDSSEGRQIGEDTVRSQEVVWRQDCMAGSLRNLDTAVYKRNWLSK
jgi:hypothetical protein